MMTIELPPVPVALAILHSAAPDGVNENKENNNGHVENCNFLPFSLQCCKNTGLARVATVAQLLLVVAPRLAICIS